MLLIWSWVASKDSSAILSGFAALVSPIMAAALGYERLRAFNSEGLLALVSSEEESAIAMVWANRTSFPTGL